MKEPARGYCARRRGATQLDRSRWPPLLRRRGDSPPAICWSAPPQPARKTSYGPVRLEQSVSLFDSLDGLGQKYLRPMPEPMENLDQGYGFILYRTQVPGPRPKTRLVIRELHDRAQVFLDGQFMGVLEREFPKRSLCLSIPPQGAQLDILVENMGRVNFGPYLLDRKGITKGVTLGDRFLFGWEIYPLPLDDLSSLKYASSHPPTFPAFLRGTFHVDDPADTFLALPGWTKGIAWLNGFNLGRYWKRGPQRTLYVPAPLLRKGENEIVVLELHNLRKPAAQFVSRPNLTG